MDYSNWHQIQQNPNPNPSPNPNPQYSVLHPPHQSVCYSQNFVPDPYQLSNVDSHSALFLPPQPRPPGVDTPYVPPPPAVNYVPPLPPAVSYVPPAAAAVNYVPSPAPAVNYVPPPLAVNYVHQPIVFEAQQGVDAAAAAVAAAAAYYPDPNVSWVAPTPQFGTTPYDAGVCAPNPAIQPERISIWKLLPKKTKIVQSAWCEVCKIDCNSKGVLDQHKLGKKHLKNLQKPKVATPTISVPIIAAPISASIVEPPTSIAAPPAAIVTSTSLPVPTPAPSDNPFIGPQQKPKSQKSRKKAAARTEDLESKRRKVLKGGAAVDAVHACSICNVVCNSDTVFSHHIAGKKHASKAKKHALAPVA